MVLIFSARKNITRTAFLLVFSGMEEEVWSAATWTTVREKAYAVLCSNTCGHSRQPNS